MTESPIKEKSFMFALKIIDLYKYLIGKNEYVLSKQILRSGTSIGANVREAQQAQSRKDFISKMSIALKESHETDYWLALLIQAELIESTIFNDLNNLNIEIMKLLTSIIKSSKE